jgi:hypothetical protein
MRQSPPRSTRLVPRPVIVIAAGWFSLPTRIIALFLGQDDARVRLSPVCWQSMPSQPEDPLVCWWVWAAVKVAFGEGEL